MHRMSSCLQAICCISSYLQSICRISHGSWFDANRHLDTQGVWPCKLPLISFPLQRLAKPPAPMSDLNKMPRYCFSNTVTRHLLYPWLASANWPRKNPTRFSACFWSKHAHQQEQIGFTSLLSRMFFSWTIQSVSTRLVMRPKQIPCQRVNLANYPLTVSLCSSWTCHQALFWTCANCLADTFQVQSQISPRWGACLVWKSVDDDCL